MPNKTYNRLSDCNFFVPGDAIEVWYAKPKFFAAMHFSEGTTIYNPQRPELTHIYLGSIGGLAADKNPKMPISRMAIIVSLFGFLQAERWSPNIEANELIQKEGCSHTSMSVGDMIRFTGAPKEDYVAKMAGWLCFPQD